MKISFLLIYLLILSEINFPQEEIKIMSWNVLEYRIGTNLVGTITNNAFLVQDTTQRNPYYRAILNEINPDIMVGVEFHHTEDIEAFFNDVMNGFGETYEMSGLVPTGKTDNVIFYKPSKFTFLSNTQVVNIFRPSNEYRLLHKNGLDTLIIYACHFKSANDSTGNAIRSDEADSIRAFTNSLNPNAYFIAIGDFNIYSTNEQAYIKLTDQTNAGYLIDPENLPGTWNKVNYAYYHTISTRKTAGINVNSTGRGGGLVERSDITFYSQSIMDTAGITYKKFSHTVYGNDGNHYNDSINDPPNNAVSSDIADALYWASDHLPIYSILYFNVPSDGDIAFTQVGATDDDVIEFVTLRPLDLTYLKITDNGVTSSGDLQTGEGIYDLSNTNWTYVPGGTFVRLDPDLANDNDAGDRFLVYNGSGSGTLPQLETGGEQLIAYTGSESSPRFIAAVNWGNSGWTSGATSSQTSKAPGSLSDIELTTLFNNYRFNGSVSGDPNTTRAALINPVNWTGSNSRIGYVDLIANIDNNELPVELTTFTASVDKNVVLLYWRTETEIQNYGFEIQRNFELMSDWEKIGFVEGHGTVYIPYEYSFKDESIQSAGSYYYRLKQIDTDGSFEYSDPVEITIFPPEGYELAQNFPNPFNPSTQITYSIPEYQKVILKVFDILGNEVTTLVDEYKPAGKYSVEYNGSAISSGVYVYSLITEKYRAFRKMILMK